MFSSIQTSVQKNTYLRLQHLRCHHIRSIIGKQVRLCLALERRGMADLRYILRGGGGGGGGTTQRAQN